MVKDGYRFFPNKFAVEAFGLSEDFYDGESMTLLLEDILGKENYRLYMVAQDPLCGDRSYDPIRIVLNKGDPDPKFATIGIIMRSMGE